jgi:hypothetical protein
LAVAAVAEADAGIVTKYCRKRPWPGDARNERRLASFGSQAIFPSSSATIISLAQAVEFHFLDFRIRWKLARFV